MPSSVTQTALVYGGGAAFVIYLVKFNIGIGITHRSNIIKLAVGQLKRHEINTRYRHSLVLTLKPNEDNEGNSSILVEGIHKYTLKNESLRDDCRDISIYTDLACSTKQGGFKKVDIKGKNIDIELAGERLENFIQTKHNKVYFSYTKLDFKRRSDVGFTYHTYGIYRLRDRLIWTVQDLSDEFNVEIVNETTYKLPLTIKINHSDDDIIMSKSKPTINDGKAEKYEVSFPAAVLPFQGFEISWNIPKEESVGVSKDADKPK